MKVVRYRRMLIGIISLAMIGVLGGANRASVSAATARARTVAGTPQGPTLTAVLVNAEKKAKEKTATVDVKVSGVELIDPAKVNEKPKAGQGHLHYRVDDGPVIATTATKLSFHELTPGSHKIMVMLAGNDHNPLGPQQTLEVMIPG